MTEILGKELQSIVSLPGVFFYISLDWESLAPASWVWAFYCCWHLPFSVSLCLGPGRLGTFSASQWAVGGWRRNLWCSSNGPGTLWLETMSPCCFPPPASSATPFQYRRPGFAPSFLVRGRQINCCIEKNSEIIYGWLFQSYTFMLVL